MAIGTEGKGYLERVSCGEFLVAGDRRGEGEECGEQVGVAFVADGEAAVAGEPGDGAFDLPAVSAEALVGVDAAAGDARGDAALAQPGPVDLRVVGFVGAELGWLAAAWSAAGADRG
jgi:hypothetical protein